MARVLPMGLDTGLRGATTTVELAAAEACTFGGGRREKGLHACYPKGNTLCSRAGPKQNTLVSHFFYAVTTTVTQKLGVPLFKVNSVPDTNTSTSAKA